MNLRKARRRYSSEIRKLKINYPERYDILNLIYFFPKWYFHLNKGRNPTNDGIPWITFPAIKYIKKKLTKDSIVFEYGMGGSTIFFSKLAGKVISVENNPNWVENVKKFINNRNNNWIYYLIPPTQTEQVSRDPSDPHNYSSSSERFMGFSFQTYAKVINYYPDHYFDIILVDGRARPSCVIHSIPKIKPGGHLIWDNTDRTHYFPVMNMIPKDQYKFIDFPGPCPYLDFFSRTSIWYRRY